MTLETLTGMSCQKMPICLNGRYKKDITDYFSLTNEEYKALMIGTYTNLISNDTIVCPRWKQPSYMFNACPKKRNSFLGKLRQADIPERYFDLNMANVNKNPARAWDLIGRYLINLELHLTDGQGLLIYGPLGTGKTTAAVAIGQEAIDKGYSVKFLGADYLISELRSMTPEQSNTHRQELLKKDLLILDGLETDKESKWLLDELGSIISSRYDNKRVMIITTNSTPEQMSKSALPQRYVERILHSCLPVLMVGKNWRQLK